MQSQLSSDDYKTIKNAEAQAAGKPLPYDPAELHAKHQAWRDRINTIEAEIAEYTNIKSEERVPNDIGQGE